MTAFYLLRRLPHFAGAALLILATLPASAQDSQPWRAPSGEFSVDSYRSGGSTSNYSGNTNSGNYNSGSYGSNGRADPYARSNDTYSQGNYPQSGNGYSQGGGAYPQEGNSGGYGVNGDAYSPGRGGYGGGNDAYAPPPRQDTYSGGGGGDVYSPSRQGRSDSYTDPGQPADSGGYGEPYAPPPGDTGQPYREAAPAQGGGSTYEQNEIIAAGHGFFGAISQNLAQAVEYAFKSQGRPNGYILGEDAGGAFVVGLRYGEGRLYTKDAGDHKVFWQGPSVGYDAGAEGSKAMVLVYNLRDPSEIYNRFGGVQGAAYLVGGLSVQFQKYGDVTLAVIRSGVGVRLGANVGYLKYTRTPTWNPL
jgi:hypothetical protein